MRTGEPERLGGFTLPVERVCELVDDAIECFGEPRQIPLRAHGALEVGAYLDNLRAGNRDAQGMWATAEWLTLRAEVLQWNRAALGALLWAARQYRDVLPAEMHGQRGHELTRVLIRNWGLRRDVPGDLTACHRLAALYGTGGWAEANRRGEAA